MKKLWTTLYLGLDPERFAAEGALIHYPVIRIVPKSLSDAAFFSLFRNLDAYTHFLFTSKSAVQLFFAFLRTTNPQFTLQKKMVIAIGPATTLFLHKEKIYPVIAEESTQEGMIKLLEKLDLESASFFLPRSSLSRPLIAEYLGGRGVSFTLCDLYDTEIQQPEPLPDLQQMDEIVFTSPSTVNAFLHIFGAIPKEIKITCIGPITAAYLKKKESSLVENFSHGL